jgi:NRPS condensation-like uncharacterized protein
VIEHHDALRLSFEQHAGDWSAQYRPMADWQLQQVEASVEQLPDVCEQAQASLDLQHGPLIRAVLIHVADGSQRLLLVIHHLAVDGVSWRILFEDLQNAYQQVSNQQPVQLPARTSSVKAWAERLQHRAQHPTAQDELRYWLAQLDTDTPDLPCERPHGSLDNRYSHTLHTHLDARQTRQLLQQAPKAYRTQINDLLLTALARVISRWTGAAHCLVELEGHGREDLFDDLDLTRTVGQADQGTVAGNPRQGLGLWRPALPRHTAGTGQPRRLAGATHHLQLPGPVRWQTGLVAGPRRRRQRP